MCNRTSIVRGRKRRKGRSGGEGAALMGEVSLGTHELFFEWHQPAWNNRLTHQSWISAFSFRERFQISPSARTQILQNKFRFNSRCCCCFFDIIAESSWVNLKSLCCFFAHENNTSWHVEPWKDCSSTEEQPTMISVVFLARKYIFKFVSLAHDSRSSIRATSKNFYPKYSSRKCWMDSNWP